MKDYVIALQKNNLDVSNWWESYAHYEVIQPYVYCNMQNVFVNQKQYHVVVDGEFYNEEEVIQQLKKQFNFSAFHSKEEIALYAYIAWKEQMMNHLLGAYSIVIAYDNRIFVCKDPLGLKPIYYGYKKDQCLIISNRIQAILNTKLIAPIISKQGLCELFAFGPSLQEDKVIYNHMYSLGMGQYMNVVEDVFDIVKYYIPQAKMHQESYEETKAHVRYLVKDSIQRQTKDCDATFLSGGLDSSILASCMHHNKEKFFTYSLDYEGNKENFKGNSYQVSLDQEFIDLMVKQTGCKHTLFTIQQHELVALLKEAMLARDIAGMADIDASLLWLCKQVKKDRDIILSGECSDEIFGGYPWFYREDLIHLKTFPWLRSMDQRKALLHEKLQNLPLEEWIDVQYQKTLADVNYLDQDKEEDRLARRQTMLCLHWFMQTLVTRQVAMGNAAHLSIRAPFADVRILDYVYNIPWHMKFSKQVEKGILRDAFADELPQEVCYRKKNPFPKTHNPIYTKLIQEELYKAYQDCNSVLHTLFDEKALLELITSGGSAFPHPWYGQLMSGPQLLAYIYQIHLWFEHYKVKIEY